MLFKGILNTTLDFNASLGLENSSVKISNLNNN